MWHILLWRTGKPPVQEPSQFQCAEICLQLFLLSATSNVLWWWPERSIDTTWRQGDSSKMAIFQIGQGFHHLEKCLSIRYLLFRQTKSFLNLSCRFSVVLNLSTLYLSAVLSAFLGNLLVISRQKIPYCQCHPIIYSRSFLQLPSWRCMKMRKKHMLWHVMRLWNILRTKMRTRAFLWVAFYIVL